MKKKSFHTLRGFSLIEVALALMVIGLGFTAMLQLFPHALREGQIARAESVQVLFANKVFAELRNKAMETDDWDDWKKDDWLEEVCVIHNPANNPAPSKNFKDLGTFDGVQSYLVLVMRNPNKTLVRVTLWSSQYDTTIISVDKGLELVKRGTGFYTEFYYMGREGQ